MNVKVLLVDDEPKVLTALRRSLAGRFDIHCAQSGEEALALLDGKGPFAAVVSDMRMPGMNGLELLREMRRRSPETVRLVLTGYTDFDVAVEAINEGAVFRFHTKPVAADVLAASIESALLRHQNERRSGRQAEPSRQLLDEVAELRDAIAAGQLRLHLQPLLSLADNTVYGAEALIRWQHPTHGLLSPGQFLGTAEAAGLLDHIALWVLEAACVELNRWREAAATPLRLTVNITAGNLVAPGFVEALRDLLERHPIAPHRLELELTEASAVADIADTRDSMEALRRLGIQIAVDDFGTGYATFGWLKQLPVDILKIDRSFIQDISSDPQAELIVKGIISLAGDLRLLVIAEGVETHRQLEMLKESGCDVVQGFLLARPMPIGDFLPWLTDRIKTR